MVDFLYQELDESQAAAFRSHVDGCARCGAELHSMQRTREAMRALPVLEPSPAISARLLHEASRRRPRRAEDGGGLLGWFSRFFTPIMAHPAWAAAAMLVLVAGVAGFLKLKGRMNESAQPVPAAAEPAATAPAGTMAPAPTAPPATKAAAEETRPLHVNDADHAAAKGDVRLLGGSNEPRENEKVPAPAIAASAPKLEPPAPAKAGPSRRAKHKAQDHGRMSVRSKDALMRKVARPDQGLSNELAPLDDGVIGKKVAPASTPPASPAPPPEAEAAAPATEMTVPPARAQEELAKPKPQNADRHGYVQQKEQPKAAPQPAESAPADSTAGAGYGSGPQAQGEAPASRPRAQPSQQQKQRAPASEEPPEVKLLREAKKSASAGNCEQALTIGRTISRMNPEFYRKRVAGDPALRACQAEDARRRKAASPARQQREEDVLDKESKPVNQDAAH